MPEKEKKLKRYNLKKILYTAGLGLLLLSFIVVAGCDFGIPDYTLFVTLDEGIEGNPGQGEHVYEDLSTVSYSYRPILEGSTLEVYLNELRLSGEGSFTMYNSATLRAGIIDIRGTWNIQMQWSLAAEATFDYEITFTGPDLLGGTFTDNRGFHGTWTGLNNALYFQYTDWSDFSYSGTIYGMTGSFAGEGSTGSFTMTRIN